MKNEAFPRLSLVCGFLREGLRSDFYAAVVALTTCNIKSINHPSVPLNIIKHFSIFQLSVLILQAGHFAVLVSISTTLIDS